MEIAAGATHVSGSSRVVLDLAAHGDALIADGRVPVDLQYSFSGAPPARQQLEIPILAAFTKPFPPSSAGRRPAVEARARSPQSGMDIRSVTPIPAPFIIFDRPELTVGNLSLRQFRIPDAPVALTIAASDRLQFNAPLSGSALFGVVDGIAQGEVAWKNGLASVTGRVQRNPERHAGRCGQSAARRHQLAPGARSMECRLRFSGRRYSVEPRPAHHAVVGSRILGCHRPCRPSPCRRPCATKPGGCAMSNCPVISICGVSTDSWMASCGDSIFRRRPR